MSKVHRVAPPVVGLVTDHELQSWRLVTTPTAGISPIALANSFPLQRIYQVHHIPLHIIDRRP